jgi:hypothetical protein
LPALAFDTDEVVPTLVNSHARIHFDGNRYSVPPSLIDKTVLVRANAQELRIIAEGAEVARHARSYDRHQLILHSDHQREALKMRQRPRAREIEDTFDALGDVARQFHLALRRQPVKTSVHLRRVLQLARLYGRQDVLVALAKALEYHTYDAAYVETILLQERRRRELPSPTLVRPRRSELIEETDLAEPDPAAYDRFCDLEGESLNE